MNLNECEVECLKNCSCAAYANSNVSGGAHGCLLWFGDLVDIRIPINEVGGNEVQNLFVRLAASEIGTFRFCFSAFSIQPLTCFLL